MRLEKKKQLEIKGFVQKYSGTLFIKQFSESQVNYHGFNCPLVTINVVLASECVLNVITQSVLKSIRVEGAISRPMPLMFLSLRFGYNMPMPGYPS